MHQGSKRKYREHKDSISTMQRLKSLPASCEPPSLKRPHQDQTESAAPPVTITPSTQLLQLLDFSSLQNVADIAVRFDQISHALIHDFRLVVGRGHGEGNHKIETEMQILEMEFYLWKEGFHEDPFTHGSEEQKTSGKW